MPGPRLRRRVRRAAPARVAGETRMLPRASSSASAWRRASRNCPSSSNRAVTRCSCARRAWNPARNFTGSPVSALRTFGMPRSERTDTMAYRRGTESAPRMTARRRADPFRSSPRDRILEPAPGRPGDRPRRDPHACVVHLFLSRRRRVGLSRRQPRPSRCWSRWHRPESRPASRSCAATFASSGQTCRDFGHRRRCRIREHRSQRGCSCSRRIPLWPCSSIRRRRPPSRGNYRQRA